MEVSMMRKYRIVHYINQFFGQIGGEEMAFTHPMAKNGPIGPGLAIQDALKDEFEIVGTVICGDNFIAENTSEALDIIMNFIKDWQPDLLIAGPAFNAGRYGPACGAVCKAAGEIMGIPAVTAMYEENPGVEMYKKDCFIVKTKSSVSGMRQAVANISSLVKKLAYKEKVSPKSDNYFAKGFKKNSFTEKKGAVRAVDMILNKLAEIPFKTELALPPFEQVEPAEAVSDIKNAKIALVTDGGLTDKHNENRLESARATKYLEFDISNMDYLSGDDFCSVHGGFETTFANKDPELILPLSTVRAFIKEGRIGSIHNKIYSTTGNGTSLKNAQQFGSEIAHKLKDDGVQAVILTST